MTALSKITQQNVNHRLSPTKIMRPFQRVFIDWLDLTGGRDGYQGDGKAVRRTMTITCKDLVLAYLTSSNGQSSFKRILTLYMSCKDP